MVSWILKDSKNTTEDEFSVLWKKPACSICFHLSAYFCPKTHLTSDTFDLLIFVTKFWNRFGDWSAQMVNPKDKRWKRWYNLYTSDFCVKSLWHSAVYISDVCESLHFRHQLGIVPRTKYWFVLGSTFLPTLVKATITVRYECVVIKFGCGCSIATLSIAC